jgi:hypothetical protein
LNGIHTIEGLVGATKKDVKLDDSVVLGGKLMPPLDTGYSVRLFLLHALVPLV